MRERVAPGSVVTVVRPSMGGAPTPASAPAVTVTPPPPAPAQEPARDADSPYGIPASAVQHCCGRGCRHCRIYWNRMKP
jgi:hypothetical protein